VTLKSRSEVTQGHELTHIDQHPWLPINIPQ